MRCFDDEIVVGGVVMCTAAVIALGFALGVLATSLAEGLAGPPQRPPADCVAAAEAAIEAQAVLEHATLRLHLECRDEPAAGPEKELPTL